MVEDANLSSTHLVPFDWGKSLVACGSKSAHFAMPSLLAVWALCIRFTDQELISTHFVLDLLMSIESGSVLYDVDEPTTRSLNGCRVADQILRLVPNVENFRTTLRCLKFWAKKTGCLFEYGGYHVPYAHKGFSLSLKLNTYTTEVYKKIIVQRCESPSTNDNRLGSDAFYAFVYPNFMVSRYGPWMETNLVLPLTSSKCQVIFDYFLDETLMDQGIQNLK